MITGEWHVVAMNVLFFVTFLIPLTYRSRASWKETGLVTAFFISLFIEMYGVPFTILFASRIMSPSPEVTMQGAINVSFAGVDFVFTIPMVYGTILMFVGTFLVIIAWIKLYKNIKNEGLVTTGIYGYSRHPQYLGFIMVIVGWMIGWPTVMTIFFGCTLLFMYIRVCRKEEQELKEEYDYASYMATTPFMI
jgi:protein-S-isoprenylcysteine O-methyltransferase Ste14